MLLLFVLVVVVVVAAAVVGVGGRDPPILYITTPDRPPLRLLCYQFNINIKKAIPLKATRNSRSEPVHALNHFTLLGEAAHGIGDEWDI